YTFTDTPYMTVISRIGQVCALLIFSATFILSLAFPKGEKKVPFYYPLLILIPIIISAYIMIFTDYHITKAYFKDGKLVREFQFYYTVYIVIGFIYLLLGIVNFIRKYFIIKVEIYRLQLRYVFVASSVAILFGAVCAIILPRFFNYTELYVLGPAVAAFVMGGGFFYSIITYNLMDISTVIHKTIMHGIMSAVIFAPIYVVLRIYNTELQLQGVIPTYVIAITVVVLFILFYTFVQPFIDRLFRREQYKFEKLIDDFMREIEKIRDFNSIIHKSIDILYQSLILKRAFFIKLNSKSRQYEQYYFKGEDIDVKALNWNSPITKWFLLNQEILNISRIYVDDKSLGEVRDDFLDFFTNNMIEVVLPIYHSGRIFGFICLGEKDSLRSFKPDEILKLQYFQTESSIHISNALSYEEQQNEQLVTRTIDLSTDILTKAVPVALPNLLEIKFGSFYIPRHREGVDYFDFVRIGNNGVGAIAASIAGGGANSAINSILLRSAFHSCLEEAHSTFTVLQRLNTVLYRYSGGMGGFITACYFYYDIRSMMFAYTNAGFPPLELYRFEKSDFESLDTEGIPLGYDKMASYGMGRTNLIRGDIGILYSLSLVNSKNNKGDVWSVNQLRDIVKEHSGRPASEIAEAVRENFSKFLGFFSPESDVVVIVFKVV
ncbi:MAG: SpoIIE family protein phosphatase, partial [Spirochaetota bacterium]|nr:SpoIIE family protein phosphatase [Spirochaetota bacterium]